MNALGAALAVALALWLLVPPGPSTTVRRAGPDPSVPPSQRRRAIVIRLALCGTAAAGAGLVHPWAAPVVFGGAWWWWASSKPRAPAQEASDLPHVVALMVGPLRAGAAPAVALHQATSALPGPAADRLAEPLALLAVGIDAERVWLQTAQDPVLGDLGRALLRAHRSGASVGVAVERLADDLAARSAAELEDRARTIGVRAAVPLGVCLLPAFLLLGVVPLAVGLFAAALGEGG